MESFLKVLFVMLFVTLAILYGSLSWAFVTLKYWNWFVLPVFPALPILTFHQCVGLSFVVSLFHSRSVISIKEEYRDKTQEIILGIVAPWLTLIMAWVVRSLIL